MVSNAEPILSVVKGDLLERERGILVHQVNCQKVAGKGLALAIREKFEGWYENYASKTPYLGRVNAFYVNPSLYIADVYGQVNIREPGSRNVMTNYTALRMAFDKVYLLSQMLDLPVYVPFKLGCGEGGGDWQVVLKILKAALPTATIIHKQ